MTWYDYLCLLEQARDSENGIRLLNVKYFPLSRLIQVFIVERLFDPDSKPPAKQTLHGKDTKHSKWARSCGFGHRWR